MNLKGLSRKERERVYIEKMTELQRIWKNPIDDNWDAVEEFTDQQLEKAITDTVGQISFEKWLRAIGGIFKFALTAFIIAGIVGLLVFGVRQLF